MKNKVRCNLKKNNKFNWRKNICKRALKEWLKNVKHVDIEVDKESFNMPVVDISIPLEFQQEEKSKFKMGWQPFSVQIKNGDTWEPLIPIGIWGDKE